MIASARSLLFVPGDRPERYAKAGAAGADLVCIDLEDAVAPPARAQARVDALAFIAAQPVGHRYGLRINRFASSDSPRDLVALLDAAGTRPAFVMLAKAECAHELRLLAGLLPAVPLIALVESPHGVAHAAEMATVPQVAALMLGGADLAAELGCDFAWEPLLGARHALVAAAAQAGVAVIDVPWLDVADAIGAQAETARVAALGFTAKALIHPNQVAPIHTGLRPAQEVLTRARRVVGACAAGPAAALLDGRLIDRPVLLAAQRVLRRAGE
ncbi:MAG TPA: aldolase/citrate lyase family protein [Roseateles sp.]|uniref:HpcH/HpaI aldolase/citrate lyase family protein n=1 Tax=Roseateles sp. TaxID=1971397 RepID=UPI002ED8C842